MLTCRGVNDCETTSPQNMVTDIINVRDVVTDIINVPGQHTQHTVSGSAAPVVLQ